MFFSRADETADCWSTLSKTPEERWEMLRNNKSAFLCFSCFKLGSPFHTARSCRNAKWPVEGCGKKHHELLHVNTVRDESEISAVSVFVSSVNETQILLPTACARLIYGGSEVPLRLLLDTGSQQTFLRSNLCDMFNMQKIGPTAHMEIKDFGGNEQTKQVKRVKFALKPMQESQRSQRIKIEAWSIDKVCRPLEPVELDTRKLSQLKNIQLADTVLQDYPGSNEVW